MKIASYTVEWSLDGGTTWTQYTGSLPMFNGLGEKIHYQFRVVGEREIHEWTYHGIAEVGV